MKTSQPFRRKYPGCLSNTQMISSLPYSCTQHCKFYQLVSDVSDLTHPHHSHYKHVANFVVFGGSDFFCFKVCIKSLLPSIHTLYCHCKKSYPKMMVIWTKTFVQQYLNRVCSNVSLSVSLALGNTRSYKRLELLKLPRSELRHLATISQLPFAYPFTCSKLTHTH